MTAGHTSCSLLDSALFQQEGHAPELARSKGAFLSRADVLDELNAVSEMRQILGFLLVHVLLLLVLVLVFILDLVLCTLLSHSSGGVGSVEGFQMVS